MKLNGKVTIITGGGTGIGKGIAKCFAEEGAKLILAQRRREVVEQTAKEVGAIPMVCDVSCKTQVQHLIDKTIKQFGRIDVLVNNAAITGMSALTPFLNCSEEAWDKVLDVNLKGNHPQLRENKALRITHIQPLLQILKDKKTTDYWIQFGILKF